MAQGLFEFENYKAYLKQVLDSKPGRGRGERTRMAEAIGCHTAYISLVLNKDVHFSPEQAAQLNRYLNHSTEESRFFLLLVQLARAGTPLLKSHFKEEISRIRQSRLDLKNRLEFKKALSIEDQATYYSAWYYAAVHVLVSVPGCRTREGLARYLGLSPRRISEILRFLSSAGLVQQHGDQYQVGNTSIHLPADSPLHAKHHTNWHLRALQALEEPRELDLHYSSAVSLAKEDLPKVRSILVQAIEEIRKVVRDSKEDTAYCYMLSLFPIGD